MQPKLYTLKVEKEKTSLTSREIVSEDKMLYTVKIEGEHTQTIPKGYLQRVNRVRDNSNGVILQYTYLFTDISKLNEVSNELQMAIALDIVAMHEEAIKLDRMSGDLLNTYLKLRDTEVNLQG